jgi:ABC-type lipoprotein release transport system permease subunit
LNAYRFIFASLRHYRRVHIAVALGVAVATAVLTGALLVGDSVTGSLHELTLERLGRIDSALVTGHLFRESLADELSSHAEFKRHFAAAEPAILMTGTLQSGSGDSTRRATQVSVVGSRPTFWQLGREKSDVPLDANEIALTQSLARELSVQAGDEVLLRLPIAAAIPADSPIGEKSETSNSRRLKVAQVLPDAGLSRFSLMPSQHQPRNAFVPLETMQSLLEKPGGANAILVATRDANRATGDAAQRALQMALRPQIDDYGIHVKAIEAPARYLQISSDELVLPEKIVQAAGKAFGNKSLQPVSTYLANTIALEPSPPGKVQVATGDSPRRGEGNAADDTEQRKVPYSTITGVDSISGIGPLLDEAGQSITLGDNEIVLNRWAADDLQAKIGDTITVTFYEPESTHGKLRERTPPPKFTLKAIAELATADGTPSPAADPNLTPELPGVTDQQSIRDWELPFELVETIRDQDEDYWDKYRTTPKAFVSLATAEHLWPSRWGTISLLRLPNPDGEAAADKLVTNISPSDLGLAFLPVKQLGLDAASGTTPFGGLFLGFSFFLIAAALMLIALLTQLGIEQRAREVGTLAALGIGRKRIARLLGVEGLVVATLGATAGIAFGVLYAWLMIAGLRTWWLAAIATPFIELHVSWLSLVLGWLIGVAVSWLTIRLAIRRLARQSVNKLLLGATNDDHLPPLAAGGSRRLWPIVRAVLIIAVLALVAFGFTLQGEAQAGIFFGSGAAALALMLGEIRRATRSVSRLSAPLGNLSLVKLAGLNAARNPGRSTLTIGLVASASFLIIAISAFRLETTDAGTGGFTYVATSDRPIHYDLNTDEGRIELGFSDTAAEAIDNYRVYSMRVSDGEDASCLNLYRPAQPRVLGVPIEFVKHGGFQWSGVKRSELSDPVRTMRDAVSLVNHANPWTELNNAIGNDAKGRPIVPVVLDAATAIYSLHLSGVGSQLTIRDAADQPVTLQVVGLLKNSVLQGNLLIAEEQFLRLFPETGGYRFFLIEQIKSEPAPNNQQLPQVLEAALSNEGFDVVDAREQLDQFLAVQNTYLSTFQSLGALGLLLGTVGLAVVQLRSVLERRGELALMRASGFPPRRIVQLVILENAALLLGGLVVGCIAAAVALLPQWAPQ